MCLCATPTGNYSIRQWIHVFLKLKWRFLPYLNSVSDNISRLCRHDRTSAMPDFLEHRNGSHLHSAAPWQISVHPPCSVSRGRMRLLEHQQHFQTANHHVFPLCRCRQRCTHDAIPPDVDKQSCHMAWVENLVLHRSIATNTTTLRPPCQRYRMHAFGCRYYLSIQTRQRISMRHIRSKWTRVCVKHTMCYSLKSNFIKPPNPRLGGNSINIACYASTQIDDANAASLWSTFTVHGWWPTIDSSKAGMVWYCAGVAKAFVISM